MIETDFDETRIDAMEEDDIQVLHNLIAGSMTQSFSSLFLHPKLDLPPASMNDVFSRVLGDGFHFMDRIKVPTHHSHEKKLLRFFERRFLRMESCNAC